MSFKAFALGWMIVCVGGVTVSPTAAPSNVPTLTPSTVPTVKPSNVPTTGTPTNFTYQPTSPPTVLYLPDFISKNVNVQGTSFWWVYFIFMYAMVSIGPAFILLYVAWRWSNSDHYLSQMKFNWRALLLLLNGWVVWLVNIILQVIFPENSPSIIIQFILIIASLLITTMTMLWILLPRREKFLKMAQEGNLSRCIICKAVKHFYKELGMTIRPDIQYLADSSSYTGTLKLPKASKSGRIMEATTLHASAATEDEVREDLYLQASEALADFPAFQTIVAELTKNSHDSTYVEMTASVKPTPICDHYIMAAYEAGLITFAKGYRDHVDCTSQAPYICYFNLVPGSSSLYRAIQAGNIIPTGNYPDIGKPQQSTVFKCKDMKLAIPYLLNGYMPSNHAS